MEEEKVLGKQPDEIYCPNCAKPVNKETVVCPNCGVQVKEVKVSPETIVLKSFEKTSDGANFLFKTDPNTLANYVSEFFKSEGSISSADFQDLTSISRQTASRDLEDLVKNNILVRQGKGRGTIYIISKRSPHK